MPSKTTDEKTVVSVPPAPAPKPGTSLFRMLGPAIPLAVALGGGAISRSPAPPPAVVLPSMGSESYVPPMSAPTLVGMSCGGGTSRTAACPAPYPMLSKGHPVDWFFVFKLNASAFPGCGGGTRTCLFGGGSVPPTYAKPFGQQYVVASSEAPQLGEGLRNCLGTTTDDPVGATFDEVYNGNFHYVIWNDQLKEVRAGCGAGECGGSWGHSKGMLAWNDAGEGMVMQVSTPSWPVAGNPKPARTPDDNTLGCMQDNDVELSQHFFALRLTRADLLQVLSGLQNASVVTDPKKAQLADNRGPDDVTGAVSQLGVLSKSPSQQTALLSTGVRLISKPSDLLVPPWQMVSAVLGGTPLRAATLWETPEIPPTTTSGKPDCWSPMLGIPGPVDIVKVGHWKTTGFALTGGPDPNSNHAKVGVSTDPDEPYAIFGDMNQQGALTNQAPDPEGKVLPCSSSQNGRGGLFFVMNYAPFTASLADLLKPLPSGTTTH